MWQPTVRTYDLANPEPFSIGVMAKAARDAANTFTFREWAARLATKAPPRDYVGQLRELYNGILERSRYVGEDEEWLDGSPRSLIGHALGAKYNRGPTCPDPSNCDLERTAWPEKGWGDCDSMASLAMAGIIALGMTPYFRTIRWPGQGAHVHAVGVTQRKEIVSVDPVAHPDHPFGYTARGPVVQYYDRWGNPAPNLDQQQGAPQMYDQQAMGLEPSYLGTVDAMNYEIPQPHLVAVPMGDAMGPRVLAIPEWHARLMSRGVMYDRTPAVTQFGEIYEYDGDTDVWVPERPATPMANYLGQLPFGRSRRSKRRARRRRVVRRVVRRVSSGIKRGVRAGASFFRKHGKKIARGVAMLPIPGARAAAMGIRGAQMALRASRRFRGLDACPMGEMHAVANEIARENGFAPMGADPSMAQPSIIEQDGQMWAAQPVAAFGAVPGVYESGQLQIADTPTPGQWYRVKRGDSLTTLAKHAYGLERGRERLRMMHVINDAAANAPYLSAKLADNLFKDGRLSLRPLYAEDPAEAIAGGKGRHYPIVWIPPAAGVEPPAAPVEVPDEPAPPEPPPLPPPMPTCPPGGQWNPVTQTCEAIVSPVPVEPEPPMPPPEPPAPPEPPVRPAVPVEPVRPAPEPEPLPEPPIEPEPDVPSPIAPEPVTPPAPVQPGVPSCPEGTILHLRADGNHFCAPRAPTPTPTPTPVAPTPVAPTPVAPMPEPPIAPPIEPAAPYQPQYAPPGAPGAPGGIGSALPLLILFMMGS